VIIRINFDVLPKPCVRKNSKRLGLPRIVALVLTGIAGGWKATPNNMEALK